MKWIIAIVCLSPVPALAAEWSGALVDAQCYANMDGNRNPSSTEYDVNRDRSAEIRYCHPGPKTKSFALVDFDGQSYRLDATGNTKAAELVRGLAKKSRVGVKVQADRKGETLNVQSIALAP